ncbi:MAG: lipocalin family protein [Pseudomonadota bacterium]
MNPKTTFFKLLLVFCVLGTVTMSASQPSALDTIPSLDVARYMGSWFEIAKYPNRFQKKCASNTRADYSLQNNGRVRVHNRCLTQDGQTSEVIGEARQIGNSRSPKLQLRFAPSWLSFVPMVWGNYWVIDLDADYQLVAVSEPKREYLWVLSRTPEVNAKAYGELLARLESRGFEYGTRLDRSRLHTQCQEHLQLIELLTQGERMEASLFLRQHLNAARITKVGETTVAAANK